MQWSRIAVKIKEFVFGRPTRSIEIEQEWKQNLSIVRSRYDVIIKRLEYDKMQEIGFPSENAPKTID